MRLTTFWDRMNAQFGAAYAPSVAADHVISGLGGRTINQALAGGEEAKTVWRAVAAEFEIPEHPR